LALIPLWLLRHRCQLDADMQKERQHNGVYNARNVRKILIYVDNILTFTVFQWRNN